MQEGAADRGLVPIENSREGGVGATLDALVFDAPDVLIVGELVHRVTYCLAAAEPIAPDEVCTVHSHPQATGQCARFLAEQLPAAAVVAAPSTAGRGARGRRGRHARRRAAARGDRHAPRGGALRGRSCWRRGSRTTPRTRPASRGSRGRAGVPAATASDPARVKTALVFWGGGDLAPGWLVDCLTEFSSRSINLTRIESRPRRVGLGSYMFFCDLEGAASNPAVAAAIAGLRSHCEAVRVLGSFPASG